MTALEVLEDLLATGEFHHATYRDRDTLWEGLHIYRRSATGFRGFDHATAILKSDPDLERAFSLVRGTGISLGAYGKGLAS